MPMKCAKSSGLKKRPRELVLRNHRFCLGSETKIMGVLNVTPDSFSDGGFFLDPGAAEAEALRMEREGAHILDIGAESSRPGSKPISAGEEIRRLKPIFKRLSKKIKIPISVDTYKYEVACMALDLGAVLINDIYALRADARLAKRIARAHAGVVLMHMRGSPESMQKKPVYRHLLKEIENFLGKALETALEAGIAPQSVVVDPGFGFGKTTGQNLEILKNLTRFQKWNLPVLAGMSRKSFIGHVLGVPVGDRLYGSVAAAAIAIQNGADILRVHDVGAHRQVARMVDACR